MKVLLYTLCAIIKVNSQLLVLLTKFEVTFFIFNLILFSPWHPLEIPTDQSLHDHQILLTNSHIKSAVFWQRSLT